MSNSIGRGAVENIIKNTVYEKYNIDGKAMKDFSRLSPTEMISDFKGSVCELGRIREDYKNGIYTKAEYNALSSRAKGEISGKMLEIGSCRKSILEDILLRSFGVKPSDFSNVKTFKDLISVFEEDKEIKGETESEINPDTETDTDKEPDIPEYDALADAELNENDAENIKETENMSEHENEEQQENTEPDTDITDANEEITDIDNLRAPEQDLVTDTDIPEEALDESEKETKDPTGDETEVEENYEEPESETDSYEAKKTDEGGYADDYDTEDEEEPEEYEEHESKSEEDSKPEPEIQYDDSGEYTDITDEQDITADQSDNIEDNDDSGDYDMPDQSTEEKENERSDAVSEEDGEYEETKDSDSDDTDTEINEEDISENEELTDAEDIEADNDTDTFAEDIISTDPETEDGSNSFYDDPEDVPLVSESEEKDYADFNKDMLEDGSDEIEITDNVEMPDNSDIDMYPENEDDIPDPQEFEDMLDSSAEELSGENITYGREDLGDYEDMGDFDYLQESDIELSEPEDPTDAEFSPDSAAEDIGEIAEEIGEAAEEGEAIIAALL